MGTVVQFSKPAARSGAKISSGKSGDADIVLFPGVRIEREEVDLSARVRKKPSQVSSRRRDTDKTH